MTDAAERWQPIATAPRDRDVLLWVPPSPLLDGLIAGHMEIGRGRDGRATHWMPLPEPPAVALTAAAPDAAADHPAASTPAPG